MKKFAFLLAALALVIQVPSAFAVVKYDSRKMTCRDATALVAQKLEVVIRYDDSLYASFYRDPVYCDDFRGMPAYLPTKDNNQCLVGYTCMVGGVVVASKSGGGVTVIGASAPQEHQHR